MEGRLGDKVRLQHILEAVSEIEAYLNGVTYDQFLANSEKACPILNIVKIDLSISLI